MGRTEELIKRRRQVIWQEDSGGSSGGDRVSAALASRGRGTSGGLIGDALGAAAGVLRAGGALAGRGIEAARDLLTPGTGTARAPYRTYDDYAGMLEDRAQMAEDLYLAPNRWSRAYSGANPLVTNAFRAPKTAPGVTPERLGAQAREAAGAYYDFTSGQGAEWDAWRGSIRGEEEIEAELEKVREERKSALRGTEGDENAANTYLKRLGDDWETAYADSPQVLETARQAQERLDEIEHLREPYDSREKALQEELDYSRYFKWEDLRKSPDFAEKSRYVPTGEVETFRVPAVTTDSGVMAPETLGVTNNGVDLTYEVVNGNPEARRVLESRQSTLPEILFGEGNVLSFMTDDEVAMYNYVYATRGAEQAAEYLEALKRNKKPESRPLSSGELETYSRISADRGEDAAKEYAASLPESLRGRQRSYNESQARESAGEHPFWASAGSVLQGLTKPVSYLGQAAEYLTTGKVDQNARYNRFSYENSAIRDEVSGIVREKWGGVGSFLYQTGMSMGDFLLSAAISGGSAAGKEGEALALAIMGSGAAADTVIEAKDRGLTDGQAFTLGTVAGAAEIVTERVSLDKLLNGTKWSKNAIGHLLANVLAEGSEEAASDVINWVADVLVAQDQSQWRKAVDEYRAQGLGPNEAFTAALRDKALEIGLDAAGGMLSGGIMALPGAVGMRINADRASRSIDYSDPSVVRELIERGRQYGPDAPSWKLAEEMARKLSSGRQISRMEVGYLINATANAEEEARRQGNENAAPENGTAAVEGVQANAPVRQTETQIQSDTPTNIPTAPARANPAVGQSAVVGNVEGQNNTAPVQERRIRPDMEDAERAAVLREKRVVPAVYNYSSEVTEVEAELLKKEYKKSAKTILRRIADRFGIFRNYRHEDVGIEFNYSVHSFNESYNKQSTRGGDIQDFGKMLALLHEIIDGSQEIETHNDKYAGTARDSGQVKEMHVFLGAFRDGNRTVPVQLEVKEFLPDVGVKNKLHVTVTLNMAEAGITSRPTAFQESASKHDTPASVDISLTDLIQSVNDPDGNFLKYVPDELLTDEQMSAKQRGIEREGVRLEELRDRTIGRKTPKVNPNTAQQNATNPGTSPELRNIGAVEAANEPLQPNNVYNVEKRAYNGGMKGGAGNAGPETADAGRGAAGRLRGASGEGISDRTGYLGTDAEKRTDGQGSLRVSGEPVTSSLRAYLTQHGVVDLGLRDSSGDSASFVAALSEARNTNKNGWAVSPQTEESLKAEGTRTFLSVDGLAGVGVKADGDITAVFKNPKSKAKLAIRDLMATALANGGNKLDCYGEDLVGIYVKYGFIPVARVAFDPSVANPGWDASKGYPDVYFMMHNGDSVETVTRNFGKYRTWSDEELKALPLMEYDDAGNYRDELMEQRRRELAGNLRELERSGRESGATEEQIGVARRIADATGRRIVFINESGSAERGHYKKGTIYVNAAYGNETGQIIAHELTHSIESSGFYDEFSRLVQRRIMETGGDLPGRLQEIRERYAAAGVELDTRNGYDMREVVAEFVERELLTNPESIESLARENRSWARKILDFLDNLLAKITKSEAARERAFIRRARDLYAQALRDTRSGVDVEAGEAQYSIGRTDDNRPVAIVDDDILSGMDTTTWDDEKKNQAKKAARNALLKFEDGIQVSDVEYLVNKTSRKEYTRSNDTERLYHRKPEAFADKMRAAGNAGDIIIATTSLTRDGGLKHERHDNFSDFAHGKVLIQAGNNQYKANTVIGITDKGENVFYDVVDMKPTSFRMIEGSSTNASDINAISAVQENPSDRRVAQRGGDVKTQFSTAASVGGKTDFSSRSSGNKNGSEAGRRTAEFMEELWRTVEIIDEYERAMEFMEEYERAAGLNEEDPPEEG